MENVTIESKQENGYLSIIIKDNGNPVKEVMGDAIAWKQLFDSPQFGQLFGR